VQQGARTASGASGKIVQVGQSIEQVSAMIADVSGAASRQSREIDQLSRTIDELDKLTQTNTRMVGSWTDRAGNLREELQRLAGLVKRFRLPDLPAAAGEPLAAPPEPRALGVSRPRETVK
jgi:methyl-accepting chemotaxis protein